MAEHDQKKGKKPVKKYDLAYRANFFSRNLKGFPLSSSETLHTATDIYENVDFIFIEMEIPGTDPNKISVTLMDNQITIKGKKFEDPPEKIKTFYCAERNFGEFERIFFIDSAVDSEQISAVCKNGLLTIKIPKVNDRRRRSYSIKVQTDE